MGNGGFLAAFVLGPAIGIALAARYAASPAAYGAFVLVSTALALGAAKMGGPWSDDMARGCNSATLTGDLTVSACRK